MRNAKLALMMSTSLALSGGASAAVITVTSNLATDWNSTWQSASQTSSTGSLSVRVADGDGLSVASTDVQQSSYFQTVTGVFSPYGRDPGFLMAESSFVWDETVVNDTGVDANFDFNFEIQSGALVNLLSTGGRRDGTDVGSAYSGYRLDISLDGDMLWSSGLRLNSDGTIVATGADIGSAFVDLSTYTAGSYAGLSIADEIIERHNEHSWNYGTVSELNALVWGDFNQTLDLGLLTAGSSYDLRYNLVQTSYLTWPDSYTGPRSGWQTYASFVDPFETGATFNVSARASNSVPEPGTFALMLAGIAGLFAQRRRLKLA